MFRGFKNHSQGKGVVGIFAYLDDLLKAIRTLNGANFRIDQVHSPTPRHEIQEALGGGVSPVRYFTLAGGAIGVLFGLALATYAHVQWHLITSGKPVLAWIPFFVIAFECCILFAVLSTLFGLSIISGLPRFRLPVSYDPRFSQDRFGILVSCGEEEEETVIRLLRDAGAEEVKTVGRSPRMPGMPKMARIE